LSSLAFPVEYQYEDSEFAILVPVHLTHGNRSVEFKARLDTGASDCLFDRSYAEVLEIDWRSGF